MSTRILLISGHGAGDPGAVATLGGTEYHEADENIRFVKTLYTLLQGYDAEIECYPYERDAYQDYRAGVLGKYARFALYDYVLEIHFNAYSADSGNGQPKGSECYVPRGVTEDAVPSAILRRLSETMGWPDRGVQQGNYAVITAAKNAGVPASLLEVCFLDDADDLALYLAAPERAAQAAAEGLAEGLGLSRRIGEPSPWAAEDCRWAVERGLFYGDGNGSFRWQEPLTREEAAAVLHRLAEN